MSEPQEKGLVMARVRGSGLPLRYCNGAWYLDTVGSLTIDQIRSRDERGLLVWSDDAAREFLYSSVPAAAATRSPAAALTGRSAGSATSPAEAVRDPAECPDCGSYSKKRRSSLSWVGVLLLALSVFALVYGVYVGQAASGYQQSISGYYGSQDVGYRVQGAARGMMSNSYVLSAIAALMGIAALFVGTRTGKTVCADCGYTFGLRAARVRASANVEGVPAYGTPAINPPRQRARLVYLPYNAVLYGVLPAYEKWAKSSSRDTWGAFMTALTSSIPPKWSGRTAAGAIRNFFPKACTNPEFDDVVSRVEG